MFANTYQSGYFLEVWDSRVNPDQNPTYKQLFKKSPSSKKNFYDKEVKSFIYELQGNQKITLPYDDRQQLSLHQRYLVLQIFIPIGAQWSVQLGINDLNANKKRINLTTNSGKQQLKYFSFRYPLQNGVLQKGIWSFVGIDIYSFCNAFKNTVFRSLDNIMLCSSCKVRRIFTMKQWTEFQIPKGYWLASSIPQTMQMIEYRQSNSKQQIYNGSLISSTGQYSKLIESKIIQSNQGLRNSQKTSPLQQKSNTKIVKLPGVNNRMKQSTPLKSSKISERIQLGKSQLGGGLGTLGKSNRSLTKADIIIQKSKIRLNSLQEKQQQILNRLKSQQNRFSEKISVKDKQKYPKNQNIFKSDLFRSQISEQNESKIRISPKIVKVKKKFEQDNIFREDSYSSSYSRQSYKDSFYERKNKIKLNSFANQNQSQKISALESRLSMQNDSQLKQQDYDATKNIGQRHNFNKNTRESKVSQIVMGKERQEIIQEDVWTDEQDQNQILKKPQTPIQQMIQSQYQNMQTLNQSESHRPVFGHSSIAKQIPIGETSNPNQTIITKQNNKEVVIRQNLEQLKSPNSELELIYDQMIGCYYHPGTNTYYEIKN